MSEVKWTPGPWAVTRYKDGERNRAHVVRNTPPLKRILISPPNWFLDEDIDSDEYAEFIGNLTLVAAAPDLYNALDAFLKRYVELVESGDCGFWNADDEEHVKVARAALAKAHGETP